MKQFPRQVELITIASILMIGVVTSLPLSTAGIFSRPHAATTTPVPSGYVNLERNTTTDAAENAIADYTINLLSKTGGFPASGSLLSATRHALGIIQKIGNMSEVNGTLLGKLVASRHDAVEGGYRELGQENSSIFTTRDALSILGAMNLTAEQETLDSITNFLNATYSSQGYFVSDLVNNLTSPEVTADALESLAIAGGSIPSLDTQAVYDYLLATYFNPNSSYSNTLFFDDENQENKFSYTDHALRVLDLLGRTINTRQSFVNFTTYVMTGNVTGGGDNSSLYVINDADTLRVNTTTGLVNLSILLDLDHVLENRTDSLGFILNANTSTALSGSGYLALYNVQDGTWDNITDLDFLLSDGGYLNNTMFSTDVMDLADYIFTNNSVAGINFNTTSINKVLMGWVVAGNETNYSISIDGLVYNYTTDYRSYVQELVEEAYSNGRFDDLSFDENYHAVKILERANDTAFLGLHLLDLVNETITFENETLSLMGRPFDGDLETLHHVVDILALAGEIANTSFPNLTAHALAVVDGWFMPDGGFGARKTLSIQATFKAARYLASVDRLSAGLATAIISYLESCHSGLYYDDENDDTPPIGDTFYAFKIYDLLSPYINGTRVPMADVIVDDIIANQDPQGFFFSDHELELVYYASQVIEMAGRKDQLLYYNGLVSYVSGRQLYYGGFAPSDSDTQATLAATAYGTMIAVNYEFTNEIRIDDSSGGFRGVVSYLRDRQNETTGGFAEEHHDILENDTGDADMVSTSLACEALYEVRKLYKVDTRALFDYLTDFQPKFNDIDSLVNDDEMRLVFHDEIDDRFTFHHTLNLIDGARLQLNVRVDDETTFPERDVRLFIDVLTPDGRFVEDALVSVLQGDINYVFTDLQNGTYSGKLQAYNQTGVYPINISVSHPEFFSFTIQYNLEILFSFDLALLEPVKQSVSWFTSNYTLQVPLRNEFTGEPVSNCTVQLYDPYNNVTLELKETGNGTGIYQVNMQFIPWVYHYKLYNLTIVKQGYRPESFNVRITVLPLEIFSITMAGAALFFIGMYFLVKAVKKRVGRGRPVGKPVKAKIWKKISKFFKKNGGSKDENPAKAKIGQEKSDGSEPGKKIKNSKAGNAKRKPTGGDGK